MYHVSIVWYTRGTNGAIIFPQEYKQVHFSEGWAEIQLSKLVFEAIC